MKDALNLMRRGGRTPRTERRRPAPHPHARARRGAKRSAGEIAAEFTVSWPAVSQHLRVLKDAGLLTERREGTRRLYRARPEGLAGLRAFLDGF